MSAKKEYRPQNRTIRLVVAYLASIGLDVYGNNVDLETGEVHPCCRDFDADEVVLYRYLHEHGKLIEMTGEENP